MAKGDNILVLGAGKSSAYLIDYLSSWTAKHAIFFTVADAQEESLENCRPIVGAHSRLVQLSANTEILETEIKNATLVISMLPVAFHYQVALLCIKHSKHMLTASYISKEILALDLQVQEKGLTFLFESGLDPGIDHMSAFDLLAQLKKKGEEVTSFLSSTGGLVDPAFEGDNPWQYKFTWNPRNVVLAGKGTALFRENGLIKKIPYEKLFASARPLSWKGTLALEFYPNRDSFKYQELYGLQDVQTFIRGTIRRGGFCEAWHVLLKLGMTDDEIMLGDIHSFKSFFLHFISGEVFDKHAVEDKLGMTLSESVWTKIVYLYSGADHLFKGKHSTAAAYLQEILEVKWALGKEDKDWVFMQHRVKTIKDGKEKEYVSTMSVKGENQQFTAMAKTVGLPLAMSAVAVFTGKWRREGIHIPSDPTLYHDILLQLKNEGVFFEEEILEV